MPLAAIFGKPEIGEHDADYIQVHLDR